MSCATYTHKFVKAFPDKLDDGILYVSVEFGTAAHACLCGCGSEVYTRFSPRDWTMKFNGETVSINPSIGNWSFACQSHYVLSNGRVNWAGKWSQEQIDVGRALDRERKAKHYVQNEVSPLEYKGRVSPKISLFRRGLRWLRGEVN